MANIMIVDDSPIFRRSLREIFESAGHRVVKEAEEGQEAIAAYTQGGIDLISMDIQLPGMDGIETVRRIREQDPKAIIIMISSLEQRSKVYEAIRLGAKHYITKPFTDEKVIEVLAAVLKAGGKETIAGEAPSEQLKEQMIRPVPRRELLKLDVPALSELPFELSIQDDLAELSIHRHITDGNIRYLHSCLQGLLYYRKAKYLLIIEEPILHEDGNGLLFDFVSTVRERQGTVGIIAEDPGYFIPLQAKFKHCVYRSRAEIWW
ncbi:response regulator [Paenibacillus mesophilus]|uniref:response regulator n=1 Tax=Paenibacillus mesophilus TaxID=2582849 RepID=UPI00110F08E6|nr:response regulator [Paenibacillus mesophilus]TMV48678.1 response regulator [Paenibacillus mesophilus]